MVLRQEMPGPRYPHPAWEKCGGFAHGGDAATHARGIYTGGSGLSPIGWLEANRVGWGIAMVTDQTLRGIAYGPFLVINNRYHVQNCMQLFRSCAMPPSHSTFARTALAPWKDSCKGDSGARTQ